MKASLRPILAFSALVILLLSWSPADIAGTHPQTNTPPTDSIAHIRLLFAGDVMQHDPQFQSAFDAATGTYKYDSCFLFVKKGISSADLAIANFETTLCGAPYSGYPQFCSPDELAAELVNSGFDILITANNHTVDKGRKGIERTISILDSLRVIHTGSFIDSISRAENYPLMVVKNDFKLAFLNYTYGTNGIAVPSPNIVNMIDTAQIRADLQKAIKNKPHQIIVTIHWGLEYKNEECQEQRDIAKFCFENGADIIIGMHPHVVQPIKWMEYERHGEKRKGLVYYSLGNYVSNQRARYKWGGIQAVIDLEMNKNTGVCTMTDFGYIPIWVYKQQSPDKARYFILPVDRFENDTLVFRMSAEDRQMLHTFRDDVRSHLTGIKEYASDLKQ